MLRNLNSSNILGINTTGVLAENIPSAGEHGSGYAYPSLDLPADNGSEIQGLITTSPHVISGIGTITSFFAYEDTSFELVVTDDCTVQWTWDLYVYGVLDTAGLTGTVTIGAGVTIIPIAVINNANQVIQ